jgi:hypothetical protein
MIVSEVSQRNVPAPSRLGFGVWGFGVMCYTALFVEPEMLPEKGMQRHVWRLKRVADGVCLGSHLTPWLLSLLPARSLSTCPPSLSALFPLECGCGCRRNLALNMSEIEIKVMEATGSEAWGPSGTQVT